MSNGNISVNLIVYLQMRVYAATRMFYLIVSVCTRMIESEMGTAKVYFKQ